MNAVIEKDNEKVKSEVSKLEGMAKEFNDELMKMIREYYNLLKRTSE